MDLSAFKILCTLLIESSNTSPAEKKSMKKLLHDFEPEHRLVSIKSGYSEILLIDTSTVLMVEARQKKSLITLLIKGYVTRVLSTLSFGQMEKLLCCSYIMKVHGSYLVNLNMCNRYHNTDQQLELIIPEQIPVSRDLKIWMPHVLSDLH